MENICARGHLYEESHKNPDTKQFFFYSSQKNKEVIFISFFWMGPLNGITTALTNQVKHLICDKWSILSLCLYLWRRDAIKCHQNQHDVQYFQGFKMDIK